MSQESFYTTTLVTTGTGQVYAPKGMTLVEAEAVLARLAVEHRGVAVEVIEASLIVCAARRTAVAEVRWTAEEVHAHFTRHGVSEGAGE